MGITEVYANQTPEQKVALVRAEPLKAPTMFMSDGINDAPALTAATVGIAFGQASDVTAQAAVLQEQANRVTQARHASEGRIAPAWCSLISIRACPCRDTESA